MEGKPASAIPIPAPAPSARRPTVRPMGDVHLPPCGGGGARLAGTERLLYPCCLTLHAVPDHGIVGRAGRRGGGFDGSAGLGFWVLLRLRRHVVVGGSGGVSRRFTWWVGCLSAAHPYPTPTYETDCAAGCGTTRTGLSMEARVLRFAVFKVAYRDPLGYEARGRLKGREEK